MSSSRTEALAPIQERLAPTPEQFRTEILPADQPVVMRGVACDWPLVAAARKDSHDAMSMLETQTNAQICGVLRTDAANEGRTWQKYLP